MRTEIPHVVDKQVHNGRMGRGEYWQGEEGNIAYISVLPRCVRGRCCLKSSRLVQSFVHGTLTLCREAGSGGTRRGERGESLSPSLRLSVIASSPSANAAAHSCRRSSTAAFTQRSRKRKGSLRI